MGAGSLLGLKQPRRGVDHPPPSSAEDKETVELAVPVLPLLPFVACCRVDCTVTFTFRPLAHTGFLPESDRAPVVGVFTRTGITAAVGVSNRLRYLNQSSGTDRFRYV